MRFFLSFCLALCLTLPVAAQDRRASHCIALADATPGPRGVRVAGLPPGMQARVRGDSTDLQLASFGAPLPDFTVRLNYVGHATFLLEAPDGTTIATDYTGVLGRTELVPTVVTMNRAHSSHYTALPDPRIPNVLRGWNPTGSEPAEHYLEIGETRVRNVTTDLRGRFDGEVVSDGNSIFVFEVAGLCIAHLGHLHHEPTEAQYAALGRMDVVMAPVDGGYTLDLPTMLRVLKRSRASIVIPMHWFSDVALGYFIAGMRDDFAIERAGQSHIEVSLRSLPARPTVLLMPPRLLRDADEP